MSKKVSNSLPLKSFKKPSPPPSPPENIQIREGQKPTKIGKIMDITFKLCK